MAKFFEKGTVSHLMALSNVRVVWFNDWYPSKELTYGICVDEVTKLVIVVFRGAITKTDWTKAMDYNFATAANPVKGGPATVKLHNGFYSYLFRKRQDTGTTKYHQIAEVAHRIGSENFGEDYRLVVCGHSLGAALSTVFSFWASTDDRFTRNGPLQMNGVGKRRQESYAMHDFIITMIWCRTGPAVIFGQQVGAVGIVTLVWVLPFVLYLDTLSCYVEALNPAYLMFPMSNQSRHIVVDWELIKRVADGKREEERLGKDKKGNGFGMMDKSLNVLYDIKANL
eukprot:scaffold87397_cov70-Cyclotella_meneghiniana.AAC.21